MTSTTDVPAPDPAQGSEAAPSPKDDAAPPAKARGALFFIRIIFGLVVAAAAVYIPLAQAPIDNQWFARAIYYAIAAMGLNLLTGFNGQISIGHGAFFGVGAFTSAILVVDHGVMYEVTIPIAALVAAVVGVLVGFPALRVKGLYLALITLGLAVLFPRLTGKYIKGDGGVALLQPSARETRSLISSLEDDQYAYFLALGIAVLLFVLAWNLVRSRTGRAMIATRDQELAASTLGVNLAATKVGAFAVSAAYAGVAGSLAFLIEGNADGTNPILYFQLSIEFLVAVVLGGSATILGPAVGAFAIVFLRRFTEESLEGNEILAPALFGAALIAVVFVLPEGIVGGFRRLGARLTRRAVPPSTLTAGGAAGPDPSN